MLKRVRVRIETERYEVGGSLFYPPMPPSYTPPEEEENVSCAEADRVELLTEARYRDDGTRVSISYEEGELSGMKGSTTTLSFTKNEPGLLSMTRTGAVRTALLFECGRRHTCIYNTPLMPFEVCVATRKVQNEIETGGTLYLDYLVELRGAEAEHTKFKLTILPYFKVPLRQD